MVLRYDTELREKYNSKNDFKFPYHGPAQKNVQLFKNTKKVNVEKKPYLDVWGGISLSFIL